MNITKLISKIMLIGAVMTGVVSPALKAETPRAISAADFGLKPDSGADATAGIRDAINAARSQGGGKLVFAPGRYDIYPQFASEKYLFVSNNDEGLKRVAFMLTELKNLEIDGQGASFVFHGPMVPFLIENSSDVTIKNLSFDFSRPIHSEGKVLAVTPESVDLEISEEFPYEIRNGILVFTNGKKVGGPETTVKNGDILYPYTSLLAFDPVKRETAFMAKDRYGISEGVVAREIGPRQVRIALTKVSAEPGQVLVFGVPRNYPGIIISDSSQVRVESVKIHNCGGMGIIAQRSADIFVHKVQVTPPHGEKRVTSITADATHFSNCRGKIELVDCLFELQKDDATNVHGLYAKIVRIFSPTRFEVRLIHPQQAGVDFIKAGTRLELTQGLSLETLGYLAAKTVTRVNKESTIVETAEPLPATVVVGDSVADADSNTAEVLIKNCIIRGNRARGILLGSRGKMVVEGNTFHTPGSAILFEGDARFWFEQAGVRDVIIRNNTFDNCNFGVWGRGVIMVGSGISKEFRATSRYNKNITIENNLFRIFSKQPLLNLYSVDGLIFRNNRVERTTAYPETAASEFKFFEVTDSDRVQLEAPVMVPSATGAAL
ncbi:MAG: hypothetical protein RL376_1519 [Verrucomicrobiota bacterium]